MKLFSLQAREYVAEQKKRGQYSRMRAWGVGGESVPLDVVRKMQEVGPDELIGFNWRPLVSILQFLMASY